MKFIDSHTHMDHKRFDSNRYEIIEQAHSAGIEYMINPAISIESNSDMRKLLDKYDFIRYAVGIHPKRVGTDKNVDEEWEKGLLWLLSAGESPKTVAIGETGLDFNSFSRTEDGNLDEISVITLERQKSYFCKQLQLAGMFKLPLILHIRSADEVTLKTKYGLAEGEELEYVNAHKEALEILKEFDSELLSEYKGVVHCFTSDKIEDAKAYIDMGYLIGVGGAFTRLENEGLKEVVRQIPLEKIILETDSPFVLPEGMPEDKAFPGKRNTPLSIPFIAGKLAELKEITIEEVATVTTENAKRLFRLEG